MQKRLNEFQQEILSFELNEKYSGIITSSVYRGFDSIQARSGLDFEINHSTTGEIFTRKNLTLSNPRGIWVSRQGTVIIEDAPIKVSVLANQYNYERWDVLVADHTHDELAQGGLEATYTVIPGGNMSEPFGLSETQTIIGRLRVPANATNASGVVWERRPIPQLGGKFPALLAESNKFEGQNSEKHRTVATLQQSIDGQSKGLIQGRLDNANSFTVNNLANFSLDLLPERPLGTLISLTFMANATLRSFSNQLLGNTDNIVGYTSGYRPLSLYTKDPTMNLAISAGETVTFRMVDVGAPTNKRPHSQYWSLVSLTDSTGKALSAFDEVDNLKNRMSSVENSVSYNTQNIGNLGTALTSHTGDKQNPHGTTKQQVGLGNLPNSKSDRVDLEDPETLATSRAVANLRAEVQAVETKADSAIANAMPKGGIIMWSGAIENIPTGYVLCDGRPAVNGLIIPDLRNKFIRGASDLQNTSNLTPDDRGQVATASAIGQQGGNNKHQMTIQQMPPHAHSYYYRDRTSMVQRGSGSTTVDVWGGQENVNGTTGNAGGLNGVAQEFNLMPQYYALAFIIKTI